MCRADCRIVTEEELVSRRRAAAVARRYRRAGRDPLHLGIDRAAQGRDAQPRQSMARCHQRRALSCMFSPKIACSACCRSASIMARTSCFSTWAAGGAVIPLDYLDGARRDEARWSKHGITTLAGVPPLWVQLLEAEWPAETAARLQAADQLRRGAAAALVPPAARAASAAPISIRCTGSPRRSAPPFSIPSLVDAHPGSIGRAIPFAEVMVVRPDGRRAAAGRAGRTRPCRPLVAQGYWQDAERTAQRFRPAPAFAACGGMAVWSGDTVVEDAGGLLRFVGRDDEMIKSVGQPRSAPPRSRKRCRSPAATWPRRSAFGVPDERLGQAILRRRARRSGGRGERCATASSANCRISCSRARYDWRAELPRNANGKVDRAGVEGVSLTWHASRWARSRPIIPGGKAS